ncbi:MAG: hypothetical protein E6767_20800 [Dysgonomonas sp.]|nr:hypothetical protein [Dysgonomonas sp.]
MTKITLLVAIIMLWSCSHNSHLKEEIQLVTSEQLQSAIDSLTYLNSNQNTYELFVHKISEYRGFILLHIGAEAYYTKDNISLVYLLSNKNKVKIYSGIESYFNLPNNKISYGRTDGIKKDKNHALWGIYLYKDSIIGIYSVETANPFLLIPSPPLSDF